MKVAVPTDPTTVTPKPHCKEAAASNNQHLSCEEKQEPQKQKQNRQRRMTKNTNTKHNQQPETITPLPNLPARMKNREDPNPS
jgi:hypothetical protein